MDILTQGLLTLFWLLLPYKFCNIKHWFVVDGFSLVWVMMLIFSFCLEEWSMDDNMVSKIWVGMFTNNIHLLTFKIQSHMQRQRLNAGTPKLIPKKKHRNFYHYIFHFASCIKWFDQITTLSIWKSSFLDEPIRCKMQNLEIVNLKCVNFTHPIWVP